MPVLTLRFRVCPDGPGETQAVLDAALEFLTRVDQLYFRRFPSGPCCPACAGVRYDRPKPGEENTPVDEYDSVESMVVRRLGRCGSIAAMVAARMRELEGRDAVARAELVCKRKNIWHAVVEVDGERKDPTAELIAETEGSDAPGACGCGKAA